MAAFSRVPVGELVAAGEAELKTGPFGTQLKASEYVEHGTPVINVRNIGFGDIKADKLEFISPTTRNRLSSHILKRGDIVFGRKGAVERHVFIRQEQDGWFQGSDCLRLRFASRRIEPLFASYYFLTSEHQRWMMNQCSHGATMASLNQGILERIELPLPSLSTQRRIADILSGYDELIENSQRRIKILEAMARALYREWFVKFRYPGHEKHRCVASPIGEIPQGWDVKKMRDVTDTFRGRSYRSVDLADEGGLPFLNLKCIDRDGGFRRSGLKRYTGEYKNLHVAKKGDIVMAVTDMTQERRIVARVALVPTLDAEFGIFSMDLVRIQAKPSLPRAFLYSFLRYSSFADEVKQHANGANVLHLSPDRITDYRFVVPTAGLTAHYANLVAPVLDEIDTLENKIENMLRTRNLLLPRLLSGQIEVKAA